MYKIVYTKIALKDIEKIKAAGLSEKARKLIALIMVNPYTTPPSYENLVGDLTGAYSRRINIQHRFVYSISEEDKIIKIIRMWTRYE
ncbi:Txe/YoeB family addiction module toxin [Fusibacter bizertensis]